MRLLASLRSIHGSSLCSLVECLSRWRLVALLYQRQANALDLLIPGYRSILEGLNRFLKVIIPPEEFSFADRKRTGKLLLEFIVRHSPSNYRTHRVSTPATPAVNSAMPMPLLSTAAIPFSRSVVSRAGLRPPVRATLTKALNSGLMSSHANKSAEV